MIIIDAYNNFCIKLPPIKISLLKVSPKIIIPAIVAKIGSKDMS